MKTPDQKDEDAAVREALKEALKEWMDAKYAEIGKWTVTTFMIAAFGALIYLILITSGWHHK